MSDLLRASPSCGGSACGCRRFCGRSSCGCVSGVGCRSGASWYRRVDWGLGGLGAADWGLVSGDWGVEIVAGGWWGTARPRWSTVDPPGLNARAPFIASADWMPRSDRPSRQRARAPALHPTSACSREFVLGDEARATTRAAGVGVSSSAVGSPWVGHGRANARGLNARSGRTSAAAGRRARAPALHLVSL